MSMLEDFYFVEKVVEVQKLPLPDGSNLGEIDDIKYFQQKLCVH